MSYISNGEGNWIGLSVGSSSGSVFKILNRFWAAVAAQVSLLCNQCGLC